MATEMQRGFFLHALKTMLLTNNFSHLSRSSIRRIGTLACLTAPKATVMLNKIKESLTHKPLDLKPLIQTQLHF